MRHFARVFAFAVVKPEWLNQHVHTRVLGYGHMVSVDIAYNVVRDIEYGQNNMSEIKTLAQKMEIGRHEKARRNGDPEIFFACGGQNRVFTIGGVFATHIGSATPRARPFALARLRFSFCQDRQLSLLSLFWIAFNTTQRTPFGINFPLSAFHDEETSPD